MKYSDLLTVRDRGDLQAMLDALAVYWLEIPKVERPGGEAGNLADDVLSYRRKLDEMPQDQVDLLWRSVKYLLEKLADIDPHAVVDEANAKTPKRAVTNGKYWIFPSSGSFVECSDHLDFAMHNQQLFVDELGVDGWKFMRAKHSRGRQLMRLLLAAGAIAGEISGKAASKLARYQVCQISLPWLKAKVAKMPLKRSQVFVYDPAKEWSGPQTGIMFFLGK